MKLIFGTSNRGKLREASDILGPDYQLVCPADMGITEDVEETGETLKANSILKAEHIFNIAHAACFADDTGLEVDALGGAPGVHSARYAGEGARLRRQPPQAPGRNEGRPGGAPYRPFPLRRDPDPGGRGKALL